MATWVLPVAAGLTAFVITGWLRRYALTRHLVDVPNARSSHRITTPRGGGGAIVVAASAALTGMWWTGAPAAMPTGVLAGGLMVAGIGFIDDHRHLPPWVRLVGHFLAGGTLVTSLGGMGFGIAGDLVAVVFVAWLINLTNFMDGIDGIAGTNAVTVCLAGAALFAVVMPDADVWLEPAILAAATAGFLVWNWPPARIFMGDVGSGYIGFMVAAFTLRALMITPSLGWSWVILSAVFITDATVTLLRRALQRERLLQGHRSHAYQHLAIACRSHRTVTLLAAGINLLWLTPIASLVSVGHMSAVAGVILAYTPLVLGALWLGAGVRRGQ